MIETNYRRQWPQCLRSPSLCLLLGEGASGRGGTPWPGWARALAHFSRAFSFEGERAGPRWGEQALPPVGGEAQDRA